MDRRENLTPSMRAQTLRVRSRHLFTNPWLWSPIARSLLLQVAVVNLAFGMVPLDFKQCCCARGWPARCCGTAN